MTHHLTPQRDNEELPDTGKVPGAGRFRVGFRVAAGRKAKADWLDCSDAETDPGDSMPAHAGPRPRRVQQMWTLLGGLAPRLPFRDAALKAMRRRKQRGPVTGQDSIASHFGSGALSGGGS